MKRRGRSWGINRREAIAALTASVAGVLARPMHAQTGSIACVLTPQTSEGPFYFDPRLVRSDITEGRPGVPMELSIRVVEAGTCAPIHEARVDVWHADARGLYSGYAGQAGTGRSAARSTIGETFLRGTQLADREGHVAFHTVYPSWYRGRTPHIHFKVILGEREAAVSQLYFPDEVNEQVFTESSVYGARRKGQDTFNDNDMFLRGGRIGGAFCEIARRGDEYRASVTIGIRRA